MKHSIRKQFAVIFISLMTGIILMCWFINSVFLEEYYIRSKTKVINNAYNAIRQAANSDDYGTNQFIDMLNEICLISNISVCVMDANSQTKYQSINGGNELEIQLLQYIFGLENKADRIVEVRDDYIVEIIATGKGQYLNMVGKLNTGIAFIMRTPLESIRESVKISNRFFAYVGIGGTIAGALIVWLVTAKITKPIMALNRISEQMVHLNFDVKYKGKDKNEIGMLGSNMNKLSASLEKSVTELKNANNELQRDIEKRKEIDEMRKEFLANVSHELKTPIALIQGYAEGLSDGICDDEASRKDYCEVILDEAGKMNRMIQMLLTLNQLESGNNILNLERFDITAMIKSCIKSAEILATKDDISVCMDDYPPIYVWGDQFKVEEVFMNYFSNAVHYCSGKKEIVIQIEEKNSKIRISVFNTGDPIPEQSIDKLWDKFYKVDKARTREYGGSGVGLSIVKAIMESMNQEYGVENYQNGVLFWFQLDCCENTMIE